MPIVPNNFGNAHAANMAGVHPQTAPSARAGQLMRFHHVNDRRSNPTRGIVKVPTASTILTRKK